MKRNKDNKSSGIVNEKNEMTSLNNLSKLDVCEVIRGKHINILALLTFVKLMKI